MNLRAFVALAATLCVTSASDIASKETVLVGKEATISCSVKSQQSESGSEENSAADVAIWWQFQGKNVTNSDRFAVRQAHSILY